MSMTGNPRVTPEVTRDVCLLARMMAANLYNAQIEDLMFEVNIRTHFLFE
jgi:phosphoenolpyruvate carboxylase